MRQLFTDGPSIGIYLDDLNIQAVEIEAGKSGGFRVRREASVPMPPGSFFGGKALAPEPLAQALRDLWERGEFTGRRVVLGLSPALCSWRRMDIPPVSHEEQILLVRNDLEGEGLIGASDTAVDVLPLALPPGDDGSPVAVVLVEDAAVSTLRDVLLMAGLTLEAAEPTWIGALRLVALALGEEVATLVLVSPQSADLAVTESGAVRFQRRLAGEWGEPRQQQQNAGGAYLMGEDPDATSDLPEDRIQNLLNEVRRSIIFAQRLAPDLPAPQRVLLMSEDPELDVFVRKSALQNHLAPTSLVEDVVLAKLPEEVAQQLGGPGVATRLLALGLALRSLPALSESNRLNLAREDTRRVLVRQSQASRNRVLTLAATVAAVNLALWFGLGTLRDGYQGIAKEWQKKADEFSVKTNPNLQQRERVSQARQDATRDDVSADRWLDLLGRIGSPDLEIQSLQLGKNELSLNARVTKTDVVLRFSQALERHLPLQSSPTVSVNSNTDGYSTFQLNAKLQGGFAAPGRTPRASERQAEAGGPATPTIEEETHVVSR